MDIINLIIILIFCHLIGDYVLQCDFIAKSKGNNWYHLFVHCMLYCVPFYFLLGISFIEFAILFISHIIIDVSKARYNIITYSTDQLLHYMILCILFIYM